MSNLIDYWVYGLYGVREKFITVYLRDRERMNIEIYHCT